MSVAPNKVRIQVTIPQALKAALDQTGKAAGLSCRDVAAIYLAEGNARTQGAASLSAVCGPVEPKPIEKATRLKTSRKSEALPADVGADDVCLTAEAVESMLPEAELAALRRDGWSPQKIAEFLNEE